MKIELHRLSSVYFLSFLVAYFLTYPSRVIFRDPDISLVNYQVAIFAPLVFFSVIYLKARARGFCFARANVLPLVLLFSVLMLYSVNCLFFKKNFFLNLTFIKYCNYTFLLISFMLVCKRVAMVKSNFTQIVLAVLSSVTFVAIIFNCLFWRIPSNVEISSKYFVGPFLRAGAGYLDPNFLSINIVILLFLSLVLIKANVLKVLSSIVLVLACFFTFSRGAIVFGTLVLVFYIYREYKRRIVFVSSLTIILLLLIFVYNCFDISFIFRRFTDAEGQSSTEDRFYQYQAFFEYFMNNFEIYNSFLGFGGLDFFIERFQVALHSYWFNLILDIGLIGPIIILLLWFYFFKNSHNSFSRYLLVFWFLQASFLPNLPDTLYLIFSLSLVKVQGVERLC